MSETPPETPLATDREESAAEAEFRESNPNAGGPEGLSGGMGISSERVGPTGPGQVGTDGLRETAEEPDRTDAPEQSAEDTP